MGESKRVIVVGAGLSGLAAAVELERAGIEVVVLEKQDAVGGRVRTDELEGFRLDRGFQVLLDSYPEVRRRGLHRNLNLAAFDSGAQIWDRNQWRGIYNPLRHFPKGLGSALRHFSDFVKLGRLMMANPLDTDSTAEALRQYGISEALIETFIRPFFAGVFLERDLHTRASLFQRYLWLFAKGRATLPARGMQQLPEMVASELKADTVRLNTAVADVSDQGVTLEGGDRLEADAVVLALDISSLSQLCEQVDAVETCGVTCMYYAYDVKLQIEPVLYLSAMGPINNVCALDRIQPGYASDGQTLLSVSVVDPAWRDHTKLELMVQEQLTEWFKLIPSGLRPLQRYDIQHALPDQRKLPQGYHRWLLPEHQRVFVAGEYSESASINDALSSGVQVAKHVLARV